MPNTQYAIRLEHITKTFGEVTANHDVSLEVHHGEILSLLGENGSGKTTLMNMIAVSTIPTRARSMWGTRRWISALPGMPCVWASA